MRCEDILKRLESLSDRTAIEGMARFGISAKKIYGVSMPHLRKLGREIGRNHELAQELWKHESRETRILAALVDDPQEVAEKQMDSWMKDFDSWEVCDQCCMNLFWQMPTAVEKAIEWSRREPEFERRAGFSLMAVLAWKDKKAGDSVFEQFFPRIKQGATDDRVMVKKAVNWALRQVGKRNRALNRKAIALAKELQKLDSSPARWVARDALRELQGNAIQKRL